MSYVHLMLKLKHFRINYEPGVAEIIIRCMPSMTHETVGSSLCFEIQSAAQRANGLDLADVGATREDGLFGIKS